MAKHLSTDLPVHLSWGSKFTVLVEGDERSSYDTLPRPHIDRLLEEFRSLVRVELQPVFFRQFGSPVKLTVYTHWQDRIPKGLLRFLRSKGEVKITIPQVAPDFYRHPTTGANMPRIS